VLDPFAGSGTTLKIAKTLQRTYVGYELYPHYQSIIEQKVGQVNLPKAKQSQLINKY
uniref:DNA methyltransferase n=1 Tax=Helicobacter rodentium TaxID=59617 RepID=UPI00260F18DB